MKPLDHLADLYDKYDTFLCDIWGVLHNGVVAYPPARTALEKARQEGKCVFLMTNSPKPRAWVASQLRAFGLSSSCYDGIITSGDVTLDMIREGSRRIFHIGPDKDRCLYDGLGVELVGEFSAAVVVCTGLFKNKTPADYKPLLYRLCSRNLPFICVNPDIIVQRGEEMHWCAGALAQIYTQFGGNILVSGKPHRPIYDVACGMVKERTGQPVNKSRILAIGDGILTDVKGAYLYGLDVLFIGAGLHVNEYAVDGEIASDKLDTFLEKFHMQPTAFMMSLS